MISYSSIKICLSDIRSTRDASQIFGLFEQAKSAVHAAGCKCIDISFSNEADKYYNPRADIATVTFKISSPDEEEREFDVKHFLHDEFGIKVVDAENCIETKEKW